ncbi:3-ketoacyl-CoA reductase [Corynascus novoguineensis]|uniref:3-ketoacyl-CoA reductase n=1 Tax=Corynascus novoguineensis TaxID=1126955 RepID=A0AAN7CKB5_9PEZI|nr:3-ketoacyl-CoA reductase [Corynascus novoguineensis]
MKELVYALAGIGAGLVLFFLHSTARFLSFHLLTPSEPLKKYKRADTDAYALITGASAGIGLGVARELVNQGFGVILLGHLTDELAAAADSIRQARPGAKVRTLLLDARSATPDDMAAAVASLSSELTITILVNNVGGIPVSNPPFRPLATYAVADVDAVINQNARFMARLTALLILILSVTPKTAQEERSLILTLSSAAQVGVPWLVMYGATKAFNRAFGAGLARELAACPETARVDSLVVVPGEVLSQANCRRVPRSAPTAERFGRDIVRKADAALRNGWREMHPHWWHGIEDVLLRIAPEAALTKGLVDQLWAKKSAWDEFLKDKKDE